LASAPTCSRLAPQVARKALSRLTTALGDHGIASSPEPPAAIGREREQSDAPTEGPQALACYHHHEQHHCSLPLCIFDGPSHALVTASLRPGTRPTGAANAMRLVRLLSSLRPHGPRPHILVRGDRHCATPAGSAVRTSYRWTDGVFGLAGNAVLLRQAAATLQEARRLQPHRVARAHAHGQAPPTRRRLYAALGYAAGAWAPPGRIVRKAEVMSAADNPRFVVTSLAAPTPQRVYEDRDGARGHGDNDSKAVQGDLHSARTSAPTFLAKAMRLFCACAAEVRPHALRTHTLHHTALAHAHPSTLILTLVKIAPQITQDKERLLLHLPRSCPVKALLPRGTPLRYVVPALTCHTS